MIERPQWYTVKFLNAGAAEGYSANNVPLQTDSDAPFRAYGIAFYVFDSSGNPDAAAGNINIQVRYTFPDGATFYSRYSISAQAIQPFDQQAPNGAGGLNAPFYSYFARISPNVLYPPRTTIAFDFSDIPTVATSRVYATLVGTKIFPDGMVWSPAYPRKYSAKPFNGFVVQIPLANLPVYNYPFPGYPNLNQDADFVWQAGAQTDQPATGSLTPVGNTKGLGIKLRDPQLKDYMNDFTPIELIFGFDNSQTPGLVYPEIYIPKQQNLFMDVAAL